MKYGSVQPLISGFTKTLLLILAGLALSSLPELAIASGWNAQQFTPAGRQINPFGYGQVVQQFISVQSGTGQSICYSINPALSCLSVSGGSSCTSQVSPKMIVSCNSRTPTPVDETAFQPVQCYGSASGDYGRSGLLGALDWCLAANYMPGRIQDTLYQYDDYVRLGINQRFGGLISELYGVDKLDRILQNGGGGTQLSLWAFSPQYAPADLGRATFAVTPSQNGAIWRGTFDPTQFQSQNACLVAHPGGDCSLGVVGPNYLSTPAVYPCADNGGQAGSPYNPLQAASSPCDWGLPQGYVDSVVSGAPNQITVAKTNIANYTRSDTMPGVSWQQTTQVSGPAAIITYHMSSTSSIVDTDFQEIPAIFLHAGLGSKVLYYSGNSPYGDVNGPVSLVDISQLSVNALQLPARIGPFGVGAAGNLGEDWVSTCDAAMVKCITIASFSSSAQDIITAYSPDSAYFGIHGFFSLTNQMNKTVTVFLFPYRFDDIIQGRSVRSWIYYFHANPIYRK